MKEETYKPQFTFGFEIEGVFHSNIRKCLDKLDCEFEIKGDGSVHFSEILLENRIDTDDIEPSSRTEYNVGVFQNEKDLLQAMEVFKNKKNYFMNTSCGLHLHIKPKTDIKKGKELFWDLDLIKKLEKFAYSSLCDCQKKRETNHFCEKYTDFERFYIDINRAEKYRFVRNHPSGTMEFRFFSPCEHKIDNVKKFLGYLNLLLSKQKHRKSTLITLEFKEKELTKNYNIRIGMQTDKNYDYVLGESFNITKKVRKNEEIEEEHDYDGDCNCDVCEERRGELEDSDDDSVEF